MIVMVRCIQTGFVVESLADGTAKHFDRIEDALEHVKQVLVLMRLAVQSSKETQRWTGDAR